MAHRFYVPHERIADEVVNFTREQGRQMRTVLRLHPDDTVQVFDGSGSELTVQLESMDGASAVGRVVGRSTPDTEPAVHLTLVQGLPKGERIEFILQKCTEVGVSEFLIVETDRSVPKIPAAKLPDRLERWRSIVREAAEQSGRVRLPSVDGVPSFKEAVARFSGLESSVIAWEQEKNVQISARMGEIAGSGRGTVFIGPEGGFSESEVSLAQQAGIVPVSLGPRILRTETAAVVASALIIYGCQVAV